LAEHIISKAEADLLVTAEKGRQWVIAVDDFDSDELTANNSKG